MIAFGWLTLVVISLAVSLLAFFWALESGQFRDQERLRYLPLADLPEGSDDFERPRGRAVPTGLLLVIVVGVCVWLAPLVLMLFRAVGG